MLKNTDFLDYGNLFVMVMVFGLYLNIGIGGRRILLGGDVT
jgi:hypothetical protein